MYIISQDSYFVMGMDLLLKAINPCATHTLIAYDRGDEQILFFSVDKLILTLNEEKNFSSFICSRFLKVDKTSSLSFLKHELKKNIKLLKEKTKFDITREIHLNRTEHKILLRLLDYQSGDKIAQGLGLDKKIVSNYKNAILRKLGLNSVAELIQIYNNWNGCFCCIAGKVVPEATLQERKDSNELKMVRSPTRYTLPVPPDRYLLTHSQ
ncbi:MAG: LuxR family transcriptional regulator [Proteobacteria bacterium]|nr:LuxR family transcriptional regulator [Pseudomonadota bacterium]